MYKFILILFSLSIFSELKADDKELFRAMRDEIDRSMSELALEGLEKPYFIEYTIKFVEPTVIKARLGSVVQSAQTNNASLTVGIRVGDYQFDNTNFFDIGLSFFGSSDDEERYKKRAISVESDYRSLRRELWMATDVAYKQATELLAKKEATQKNRMRKDTTHDFIRIKPEKNYIAEEYPAIDVEKYSMIVKKLSGIFNKYPEIISSSVGLEYIPKKTLYANSEGVEYSKTELHTGLEVVAFTQSEDGMPLVEYYTAIVPNLTDLPSLDSLQNAAKNLAENLTYLYNAPVLEESYSGPILFVGNAAAEVFAQQFAPHLVAQRFPQTERGVQESERYAAFQNKVGGRVLPEFLSVDALPSKKKYENTYLSGNFLLDDDGLKPKDIKLVENGYLKDLLSSRVPTKRIRKSNGHKRGGAPMLSSIFLSSQEEKQLNYEELKSKLLSLCKDRELPYGIIVKKLLNQNIMFTTLFNVSSGLFEMPRGQNKLPVVEVYKIYPDGREELIRGSLISGLTAQSFKDIIFVGDNNFAYNYLAPSVLSTFVTGGEFYISSSIVTPALLFEDAELITLDNDFRKPPYLANPLAE